MRREPLDRVNSMPDDHRKRWTYHDEEERRKWQDPDRILRGIGLTAGNVFFDMGCGEGFFTVPAAKIVGPTGRVYGIDTNDEAIARLREKSDKERLDNIVFKVQEGEESTFCDACGDFVFFGIVLHDFRDPLRVLRNSKRMLKPAGKLVNLDWKKERMENGPPFEKRLSEEKAAELIRSAGFRILSVKDAGSRHYLITAAQ